MLLQQALCQLRPEIGDHLTVTLVAVERNGNKTLKIWEVELIRKDTGETQEIDQTVNVMTHQRGPRRRRWGPAIS